MTNQTSINDFFLQACKNNNVSMIKEALAGGADINLLYKVSDIDGDKTACLYFALEHQNYDLFFHYIEHGVKIDLRDTSIINKIVIDKQIDLVKYFLHLDPVTLLGDPVWPSLSAGRTYDISILSYFFHFLEQKEYQSYLHESTIDNMMSAALFYGKNEALSFISQQVKKQDFLLNHIQFFYKEEKSVFKRNPNLFKNINCAIQSSNYDNLDCLINDFTWEISQQELYSYAFCYAAHYNRLHVLDYIWSKGYDFDETNLNMEHEFLTKISQKFSQDTIYYIKNFIEKKKFSKQLDNTLKVQTESTKLKI